MREKHDPNFTRLHCTEEVRDRKFIRRNYLCKNLQNIHQYNKVDAIPTALDVSNGDRYKDDNEDISDDDRVFDLIEDMDQITN